MHIGVFDDGKFDNVIFNSTRRYLQGQKGILQGQISEFCKFLPVVSVTSRSDRDTISVTRGFWRRRVLKCHVQYHLMSSSRSKRHFSRSTLWIFACCYVSLITLRSLWTDTKIEQAGRRLVRSLLTIYDICVSTFTCIDRPQAYSSI